MSDKSALTALIGYLAAWEDREGAMAAMMPHEFEPFMEGLKKLCVRYTPRTARHELSALAQPDAQAQQPVAWVDVRVIDELRAESPISRTLYREQPYVKSVALFLAPQAQTRREVVEECAALVDSWDYPLLARDIRALAAAHPAAHQESATRQGNKASASPSDGGHVAPSGGSYAEYPGPVAVADPEQPSAALADEAAKAAQDLVRYADANPEFISSDICTSRELLLARALLAALRHPEPAPRGEPE